tara:strand:+ start:3011 stop:3235 length:225 start_codon:yes stop_codon:yes gene_type:complete
MAELKPLIVTTKDFSTKLYFYYPETDELFILKNYNKHLNLRLFGTFRNIHLWSDDLVFQGFLKDFKDVDIQILN